MRRIVTSSNWNHICKQYGAPPLIEPSNSKNKKIVSKGRKNFHYHKKQSYKDNSKFYKNLIRKMIRNITTKKKNNKPKPKDKYVKCYKGYRFGHYANKCKLQEKINQISNLYILEELK